jgi:hypothetical protein
MNMKKIIIFTKQFALAASILCIVMSSCSDMNDLADRFLDEGEIIYTPKVDSISTHTGYKKIAFDISVNSNRIDKIRIYWNNYQDSMDVQVGNQTGVFRTLLDKDTKGEDMKESSYVFYLVSIDSYGNKSLPVEVSGDVIGDEFKSFLRNRSITSAANVIPNELTVDWGSIPNYSIGNRLTYTNTSDKEVTVAVLNSENQTLISDWKSGLSYVTEFVYDENALDTLYLEGESVDIRPFESFLRVRNISYAANTGENELTVTWESNPAYSIGSRLTYINTSDEEATIYAFGSENSTVIPDLKSGLGYVTEFLPQEGALDTVRLDRVNADWRELSDKSLWSINSNSGGYYGDGIDGNFEGWEPEKAIDGNPMSTWHTNTVNNFPHYIIVDFGAELQFDGIVFQNRIDDPAGNNWPKEVKWEASNDLNSWVTIRSGELANTENQMWLPCTAPTSAKYLRLTMNNGWNGDPYGYIGEMGVFQIMN